jgi:hypothetical protein
VSLLYTPDGGVVNTERKQEHWPLWFMKMLHVFAMNAGEIGLGLHCERCKQPLSGQNADSDNFWHMECHCRKYIGRNPQSSAAKQRAAGLVN